eukprot:s3236_g2.t1
MEGSRRWPRCKVEEVREITLDKILEVSGFGDDPAMKTKVTESELELLQNIGFILLVEPKPQAALQLLAEEQRNFKVPVPDFPGSSEHFEELLSKAETFVYDLCISNNSLLLLPASIIFAAAWGAALDEGHGNWLWWVEISGSCLGHPAGTAPSSAVLSMLTQNFKGTDKDAVARMMKEALRAMKQVNCKAELDKLTMQEIAKAARKCQRAFGMIHEERRQRSEAHRKERKRRRNDMKAPKIAKSGCTCQVGESGGSETESAGLARSGGGGGLRHPRSSGYGGGLGTCEEKT